MFRVAIEMLMHDKTKYMGLFIGIGFTAFLVTFSMSFLAGFMSRGFALVSENPSATVWVMDSAVSSPEATVNMSDASLGLVCGVKGVEYATALYIGDVTARFANGYFQKFQVIGVDDATLSGAPKNASALCLPESVIVDSGGTSGKLQTSRYKKDMWSHDGSHLHAPIRELQYGDKLLVNDKRVIVADVSHTIARFPPRPLLYTTQANFKRLIPAQKRYITFIMVRSAKGVSPEQLSVDISAQTGLKAITSQRFKKETVLWYMINSEDVGDMINMVVLAMLVGFGVTGVMLYMFTYENIKQYAVLKAMGASKKQLSDMVFTQAFVGVIVGSGIGIAVAALIGQAIAGTDFPFRMMWFAPLFGFLGVLIVSITAAFISLRPIVKMESAVVFKI